MQQKKHSRLSCNHSYLLVGCPGFQVLSKTADGAISQASAEEIVMKPIGARYFQQTSKAKEIEMQLVGVRYFLRPCNEQRCK